MLPMIPVRMTAATVMEEIPPWLSAIPTAMGVVTDLGRRDQVIASSSPNRRQRRNTLPMEVIEPTTQPARIGSQFFFRSSILVYTDTARQLVAGARNILMMLPPSL